MSDQQQAPQPAPSTGDGALTPPGIEIPGEYITDGKILGQYGDVRELLDALGNSGGAPAPVEGQVTETPQPVQSEPGGAPPAPEGAPEGAPRIDLTQQPAAPEQGLTSEYRAELAREAMQNDGKLTPQSYEKLKGLGYPQDIVDEYLGAQMQVRQFQEQQIAQQLGGAEVVQELQNWAVNNLGEAERNSIQQTLDSSSVEVQLAILRDLKARAGIGGTVQGTNVQQTGVVPFMNDDEMHLAMQDERYGVDPRFTQQVEDRTRAMLRAQGLPA